MKLVKTIQELREYLKLTGTQNSIGFVPTMGALHDGHLELVRKAVAENELTVVSIFVNPTQFNDPKDLSRYPRTLGADLKLLQGTGCNVVFAPDTDEVYPEPDLPQFSFGRLEQVMEGKHRPGHFNGVAQVVSRLFNIVQPQRAYFGLKDYQQLVIVKEMTRQLNLDVEIIPCKIVREESGLAMSSRNELLTTQERQEAALIYKTLCDAVKLAGEKSVSEIEDWVKQVINNSPFLNVEYFEIVDSEMLQKVENWSDNGDKIGCIAVFCGNIRLIDNIRF